MKQYTYSPIYRNYKIVFAFLFLILVSKSPKLYGQTYLLNEDFSSAQSTNPPPTWSNTTINGQNYDLWHFDNPCNRIVDYPFLAKMAIFDSDCYSQSGGTEEAALTSPFVDCSSSDHLILAFDHLFIGGRGGSGKVEVWDGSWNLIQTYTDSTENPEHAVHDISAWAGNNPASRLRFVWQGDSSYYWALDNIKIISPLDYDLGIEDISAPQMPFPEGTHDIKINLKNYGYETITSTTIRWTVNGVEQTPLNWSGSLSYDERINDVVIGSLNFPAGQVFEIEIWQENPNGHIDENPLNDSMEKSLYAAFCGDYTIGGLDGDFSGFTEAVNALHIAGVSCPVVFYVRNGDYCEQIKFDSIAGTSAINTITFRSETNDYEDVRLRYNLYSPSEDYTIKLNSTQHIHFYGISFYRQNNLEVAQIYGSKHCRFDSCAFQTTLSHYLRLYNSSHISFRKSNIRSHFLFYPDNNHIHIDSCECSKISSNGSSEHVFITNNTFDDLCQLNASGNGRTSCIDNNLFKSQNNTMPAIETSGNNIKSISGNSIIKRRNGPGIKLASKGTLVSNNYIMIEGDAEYLYALIIDQGSDSSSILFNTINHNGYNPEQNYALYAQHGNSKGISIKNNIFGCKEAPVPIKIENHPEYIDLNYNDYYSPGGITGIIGETGYSSLSEWQAAVNGDSNSFDCNPYFLTDSTPDINQALLNNAGLYFADVPYDIDSALRNNPPDIGAKEFQSPLIDAGLNRFLSPQNPLSGTPVDVSVELMNHGTQNLSTAEIQWEVNGTDQGVFNWTGNLGYKNTESVIISPAHNFNNGSIFDLKAWVQNPNGVQDTIPINDTVYLNDLCLPLCGDYTIGGNSPDFYNFRDAVTVLNEAGITCPVTFWVRPGDYKEQISINNIPGSSPVNTVTFRSETGNPLSVHLFYDADDNVYDYTINFSESKYLIFKQISIGRTATYYTAEMDQANDILFDHCRFTSWREFYINASDSIRFIHCDIQPFVNIDRGNSNFVFNENVIKSLYSKDQEPHNTSFEIINNEFITYCSLAAYGLPKSSRIDNNIFKASNSNYPAIEVYGNNISSIRNNKIRTRSFATGIAINASDLVAANNYISIINGGNDHAGIALNGGADSCRILFNTVSFKGSAPAQSRALHIENGITGITLENNILSCPNGGIPADIEEKDSSWRIDHNNYHSPDETVGIFEGEKYTDMEAWRTVIEGDTNSFINNPYLDPYLPWLPHQSLLNNSAKYYNEVDVDIDSTTRNQPTDMGVIEFNSPLRDAGLNKFTEPSNPLNSVTLPIKAVLMNHGTETLHSVRVQWEVNDVLQNPINWTGSLPYKNEEEITFDPAYNFIGAHLFHIKAWCEQPNGHADTVHVNDTIRLNDLVPPLCGSYTIGGSDGDFPNFNDAITALNIAGIGCPVVFNVRDGVYLEQFEILEIPGSSEINTVTFQSESGDSSAVTVWNKVYNSTKDYTIKLNNAKNLIFNKITFKRNNNFYIAQFIGAENITIRSCAFLPTYNFRMHSCKNIRFFKNYLEPVFSLEQKDTSILFRDNIIKKINSNASTGKTNNNIVVAHNTILDGVMIYSTGKPANSRIDSNKFVSAVSTMPAIKSIGNNMLSISNNRITNRLNYSGIELNSDSVLVANNFIHIKGSVPYKSGIIIKQSSKGSRIYYNTVNNTIAQNHSYGISIEVGFNDSIPKELILKNNLFNCKNNGIPAYFSKSVSSWEIDYNNYYTPNGNIGYYEGQIYNVMNLWGQAILGDANSLDVDPLFQTDEEPQPYQRLLNGAGLPIIGLPIDIDGRLRNDQAPDIGAVEFKVDFGITQLITPDLNCAHDTIENVTIQLRQFGDLPFTNIKIAYQVNGGNIVQDTIAGSISNDLQYTFSEGIDISQDGEYHFKIWLIDVFDDNPNNDTLNTTRYSKPSPEVSFTYSPDCEGRAIQFQGNASVGGGYFIDHYEWLFSNSDSSSLQNPQYAFEDGGSQPVLLKAFSNAGCYSDTLGMAEIWFNPIVEFHILDYCSQDSTRFVDESLPVEGSLINWAWDFGDGNTSTEQNTKHKYGIGNDYDCRLTVSNTKGCQDSLIKLIHIYETPEALFFVDDASLGSPSVFRDSSQANEGQIDFWYWDFGDGNSSTLQEPQHTYAALGVYEVSLTVTTDYGCMHQYVGEAVVSDNIQANFSANTVCFGDYTTFTDLSTGNSNGITSWNWNFGDGSSSTEQNPQHFYAAAGDYNVSLSISNNLGLVSDTIKTVHVYAKPLADYSCDTACWGDSTSFTDLSYSSETAINQWIWNFGDPTSGAANISNLPNPKHEYAIPGDYDTELIVTNLNGCSDTIIKLVPAGKLPQAWAGQDTSVCENSSLHLDGETAEAGNWYWATTGDGIFSDPQNLSTDYLPGTNDLINGNFEIILNASASAPCQGEAADTMLVNVVYLPLSNAGADTNICENASIRLNGSAQHYSSLHWTSLGDGSFDNPNNPNAVYTPGSGDISSLSATLVLTANPLAPCMDAVQDTIQITLDPAPSVNAGTDQEICANMEFQTNASAENASTLLWTSSGDGSFSNPNDINTVYSLGQDDVQNGEVWLILTATGEATCSGTFSDSMLLSLLPKPVPAFISETVCEGNATSFTDISSGAPIISWYWDFGDGATSTEQNPTHFYDAPGTYELSFTVTSVDGCSSTKESLMSVLPLSDFDFTSDTACSGQPTQFSNYFDEEIKSLTWYFGDSATSEEINPQHTYPAAGTYECWLFIENINGCPDSLMKEVRIIPGPVARMDYDHQCANPAIQFKDISETLGSEVISRHWDFGDGATSNLQDPLHSYSESGEKTVTLEILCENGCSASISESIDILPAPEANFTFDHACTGQSIQFTDLSSCDYSEVLGWHWDFGNGSSSGKQNPEFIFNEPGSQEVILTVFSKNGCFDTCKRSIDVKPAPKADFSYETACSGSPTHFTDLSSSTAGAITNWLWEFDDGSYANAQNPIHIFQNSGAHEVRLTVYSENGCPDTRIMQVMVLEMNSIELGNDTAICPGDVLLLDAGDFENYAWQDGSNKRFYTATEAGTYWVEVWNANGCSKTDTITISYDAQMNISGTISLDGTHVPNALVKIYPHISGQQTPALDSTWSDENGLYQFRNISPCANYLISAYAADHEYSLRTWFEQAAFWKFATAVDTSLGINNGNLDHVDIELLSFYLGGNGSANLYGNVSRDDHSENPNGKPMKDVDMYLQKYVDDKDENPWKIVKHSLTNEQGDYSFTEVSEGDFRIVVDLPCLPMDSMYHLSLGNQDTSIFDLDYIVDSIGIYIVTTGTDEIFGAENYGRLSLWPNPNKGDFRIRFENNGAPQKIRHIEIMDISGKKILYDRLNEDVSAIFEKEYQLEGIPPGTYVLRFVCEGFVVHRRFVVH